MKAEVHCSHTRMVPLKDLKPHPKNPNTHPREQIDRLAHLIRSHGWRLPITVSKRSGYIVRGHARLEAAQLLDLKEAPVDEQDYRDEASEVADLIADNKIQELAVLDERALKVDLIYLKNVGLEDMTLTGFSQEEVADLIVPVDPENLGGGSGGGQDPPEELTTCPSCGFQWKEN